MHEAHVNKEYITRTTYNSDNIYYNSTPIHPSVIKSSWDSSSPDTTITCIHQQQSAQPELDASLAHQDQDQDQQETEEVSPQDITEGTTLSHQEARMTESREEST